MFGSAARHRANDAVFPFSRLDGTSVKTRFVDGQISSRNLIQVDPNLGDHQANSADDYRHNAVVRATTFRCTTFFSVPTPSRPMDIAR